MNCLLEVIKEIEALEKENNVARLDDADVEAIVKEKTHCYNQSLIASASTRQYESAILTAEQVGVEVPPSPFTQKQQQQSRYDGQMEEDGISKRPTVKVV